MPKVCWIGRSVRDNKASAAKGEYSLRGCLALKSRGLQIPPVQIERADQNGQQHDREGDESVLKKADRLTGPLGKAGYNQVGTGADQGAIAAEAGTQRQRPPQRQQSVFAAEGRSHGLNQRDHGGDKGDVIDDCR